MMNDLVKEMSGGSWWSQCILAFSMSSFVSSFSAFCPVGECLYGGRLVLHFILDHLGRLARGGVPSAFVPGMLACVGAFGWWSSLVHND